MIYLKIFEKFNLEKKIQKHFINDDFLYHYTLTDNLEEILQEGLIPRHYPNSHYKNSKGVFLTNKMSLYQVNLPQTLMDEMEKFYNDLIDEKPIIKLIINASKLDIDKFIPDDDYLLNKYNYNNAKTTDEEVVESLKIWGSVAYDGIIPRKYITSFNFNYLA